MLEIRGIHGELLNSSRNLRGIRRYCGKHTSAFVSVRQIPGGEGYFRIKFCNGSDFSCNFASFTVLCQSIRQWRNLAGTELLLDGKPAGTVSYRNAELVSRSC